MPKNINISVTTMDAELQFNIQSNTIGKHLFEQIIKTIGLRESWYFGLMYLDIKGNNCWLDLDKKVININIANKNQMDFQFLAKFYPEDLSEELIQEVTIKLFYLQVRESILRSDIFCPPDTALLLSSYACQVKFGDYDANVHKSGFLLNERILPTRILNQYNWSNSQWEDKIMKWYMEHQGMLRDEAMMEYLKIAQDLEMYGVSYYEIKNKKGSQLYLGVDALGLNIYKFGDKLTPQVGFPWGEIRNISFKEKRFVIKSVDKKAPEFVFYVNKLRVNKNILGLCAGNHELFVRRRNEDSIDVQQMKAQAKEEKQLKKTERERLIREKLAREAAEKRLHSIERRLEQETQEHALTNQALLNFRESVEIMREQLDLENKQRIEMDMKQQKSIDETKLLNKPNHDVSNTNIQVESEKIEIQAPISENDNNNIVLRKKHERLTQTDSMDNASTASIVSGNVIVPQTITSIYMDKAVKFYKHDLTVLENGDNPEESLNNRHTVIESNIDLNTQLKSLGKELKNARNSTVLEDIDKIHEFNKASGLDKFQTLRLIRQGNTKKRIDAFESM